MGADLYIQSLYDFDEEQRLFVGDEVNGYFRDSYNDSCLFAQLRLSWWQDMRAYLNDDGMLVPEQAKKLYAVVQDRVFSPTLSVKELAYFVAKKQRFLEFLQRAIDMNEPIYCSI
jgi:hypothetical protein